MKVHAFLGPTLDSDSACELAAARGIALEVHPPARCGDLLRLLNTVPPDPVGQAPSVLLIDGVYERVPALWHKEILALLAAGGRVIGCSSMGALRAVECAPWGAQPTGRIANDYLTGVRISDADVAVAHADAQDGYRALSVPLVDVDAASEHAQQCGILSWEQAAALRAKARAIFYAHRTWPRLLEALDPDTANQLSDEVIRMPGRKEQDARDTLTRIDQLLTQPVKRRHDPAAVLPTQQLLAIRAQTQSSRDAELLHRLEQRDDWPELLRAGLIRALLSGGIIPDLPVPSAQKAVIAAAGHLGLNPEDAVVRLAELWETSPAHVVQICQEQSQLAHLWACHGMQARTHVLDHLRITGNYPAENSGEDSADEC